MTEEDKVIEQTKQWIRTVVIDCNFCPFAAKPFAGKKIRYKVLADSNEGTLLETLIAEWQMLDANAAIETSFLIFKNGFEDFESYLGMIHTAEELLADEAYEGVYQLASFHPLYQFAGSQDDDAANYTNRSVYPMLHLLREESIDRALEHFKSPENIPETNINFAREKGLVYMKLLRDNCL